jgi:endonuclease/exonuclease/phosphatase family metal-dependent hydrolase
MKLRFLAVGLMTTSTALMGLAGPLTATPAMANSGVTLHVGTFNIATVAGDKNRHGAHAKWADRRSAIASQILSRHLDVVGLQEASQSIIYRKTMKYGDNQFSDLVGQLNAMGGHYAVTKKADYNCRRSFSKQHCHYKYRGASADTRIIYNKSTVKLDRAGSYRYKHNRRAHPRFLATATFTKAGHTFFFADTHLEPHGKATRKAQWSELIKQVNRRKNGHQVVVVGDFNSSKYDPWTRRFLPKMKRSGYGDTINQSYGRSTVSSRRAAATRNAWINSFNGWRRNVKQYGYYKAKGNIGNSIDWIFASNNMHVSMWEVVSNYDSKYQVKGTIPSDHNMIHADLTLG